MSYADGKLTFDVKVPRYAKHQFRELTVNILTSDPFVPTTSTTLRIAGDKGKDNPQNWFDYIYVQKLDAVQPFLLAGSEMSSGVQQNDSGQVESVEVEKDETYNSETFTLY